MSRWAARISAAALVLGLVFAARAEMREWTSAAGSKVVAEFVQLSGNLVTLRDPDGNPITIFLHLLSAEDQAYIQELLQATAPASPAPAAAAAPAPPLSPRAEGREEDSGPQLTGREARIVLSPEDRVTLSPQIRDPRTDDTLNFTASLTLDTNSARNRNWREGRQIDVVIQADCTRVRTLRGGQTQSARENGTIHMYLQDMEGNVILLCSSSNAASSGGG